MKRFLLVLVLMAFSMSPHAKIVCDEVEVESLFVPSGKTIAKRNCRHVDGVDPYYGPTIQEGEVSRITKHADGTVTVYRAGRPGEEEEWKETTSGEWSRVR